MYAATTEVPVERSRGEIERLLTKHKCLQHLTMTNHEDHKAIVQFKMQNRVVRFELALPVLTARYPSKADIKRHEQSERQRWRALLLVLKAKMEAIENKISTFDSEFLAHIVIPSLGDVTVGEYLAPQLARVYEQGGGQLALPAHTDGE